MPEYTSGIPLSHFLPPSSTSTPSQTASASASATSSSASTPSQTASASASATSSSASTPSQTASASASATSASTPSHTASASASATSASMPSRTASASATSSSASTPSQTASIAATATGSTPALSPTALPHLSPAPTTTPPPRGSTQILFVITLRGSNPSALASDAPFLCALQGAFSGLAAVPVLDVRVVFVRDVDTGALFFAQSPTMPCPGSGRRRRRRLLGRDAKARLAQSISNIDIQIAVDIAAALPGSSGPSAEASVRGRVASAFAQNTSLVDTLFAPALQAACLAQNLSMQSCPSSASSALSVADLSSQSVAGVRDGDAASSVPVLLLLLTVLGTLGAVALVALAIIIVKKRMHNGKVGPEPV